MINKDRIVPVQATDLLSLYSTIMYIGRSVRDKLDPADVDGNYIITETSNTQTLLSQPVKSVDIADGVTSAYLYFVPDYTFEGVRFNGTVYADGVDPDGCSLWYANCQNSTVTFEKLGF